MQREHRVATASQDRVATASRLRQVSVKVPVDMSDAAQADAAAQQDPMQVASAGRIRTGTGLTPPTSALGLGSPRPHPHRDWAYPAHIRTGTGAHPARIRTGTGTEAHRACLPGSAGRRAAAAHRRARAHQRRVRAPAGPPRPAPPVCAATSTLAAPPTLARSPLYGPVRVVAGRARPRLEAARTDAAAAAGVREDRPAALDVRPQAAGGRSAPLSKSTACAPVRLLFVCLFVCLCASGTGSMRTSTS